VLSCTVPLMSPVIFWANSGRLVNKTARNKANAQHKSLSRIIGFPLLRARRHIEPLLGREV